LIPLESEQGTQGGRGLDNGTISPFSRILS
jgi:hypothetical protein